MTGTINKYPYNYELGNLKYPLNDVVLHYTDNEHYYTFSIAQIWNGDREKYADFFNLDPILCDVSCTNEHLNYILRSCDLQVFKVLELLNSYAEDVDILDFLENVATYIHINGLDADFKDICECIANNDFYVANDCYTDQDLGIYLAEERGIINDLEKCKVFSIDGSLIDYFDFEQYGRNCRLIEDWNYYNGNFYNFMI